MHHIRRLLAAAGARAHPGRRDNSPATARPRRQRAGTAAGLAAFNASPCGVAVDGAHVFWAEAKPGTIGRANLDGTGATTEFLRTNGATGVAVSPQATVTPPGAPAIRTAAAGTAGGASTATARWGPPASTGGSAVTGYRVRALRMSATGTVLATTTSAVQPGSARQLTMTLAAGNYRFTVQAINKAGPGPRSARSNLVAAR